MTARRVLLLLVAASALAAVALSPVPVWLIHDRTVLGEGYRHVLTVLPAWKTRALPVTGLGVGFAAAAGLLAVARLTSPRVPAAAVPLTAAIALALLIGSAVPIGQRGHASLVDVTPGWALLAAIALLGVATLASLLAARPSRRALLGLATLVVLLIPTAAAGRVLALDLAEGTGRHYSDGTYTRVSADGEAGETLTLANGTYRVDQAWSGKFEGSGLVVALTDDPACPDARGSYHIWAAGDDAIRWEEIIDTCADGARSAALTGTWTRDR